MREEPDRATALQKLLQAETYLRERVAPDVGDASYLHLSDLRMAMEKYRSEETLDVLDYGCGCSPYRLLFPNSTYKRADFPAFHNVDYVIDQNGSIGVQDETFDVVLSTQVLEHVRDARHYLEECFRVLRPGGRLICSTHGSFQDHACPYDFYRWTAGGLRVELERAGFIANEITKLTTGVRAVVFCVATLLPWIEAPRRSVFGFSLRLLRRALVKFRGPLNAQCDRHLAKCRVAAERAEGHDFYIAILAEASKPGA